MYHHTTPIKSYYSEWKGPFNARICRAADITVTVFGEPLTITAHPHRASHGDCARIDMIRGDGTLAHRCFTDRIPTHPNFRFSEAQPCQ